MNQMFMYRPSYKCTGCGKRVLGLTSIRYYIQPYNTKYNAPAELIFCKTCTDHLKKNKPIFFNTYTFEEDE